MSRGDIPGLSNQITISLQEQNQRDPPLKFSVHGWLVMGCDCCLKTSCGNAELALLPWIKITH